eukprot:6203947-Pleurochrysis_carterae.AAC.1
MARRVPYGDLTYVESRYRIPYASLIQAQEEEEEEVVVIPTTFSSWNIPMTGPVANSLTEVLKDDFGIVEMNVGVYYTDDFNNPHNVFRMFPSFSPDFHFTDVYRAYNDPLNSFAGKFENPGAVFKHPDTGESLLLDDADMTIYCPPTSNHALVFRVQLPLSGRWLVHDTFIYSLGGTRVGFSIYTGPSDGGSSVSISSREEWLGILPVNVEAFVASYSDRAMTTSI